MIGQGLVPAAVDPLVEARPLSDTRAFLDDLAPVYAEAAKRMPPHRAFIDRFCAPQPASKVSVA